MSTQWNEHVALVTGGARGLGFAVARRLAGLGAKVAVDRRAAVAAVHARVRGLRTDELDAAVERLRSSGARAIGVPADVRSRPDVAAAVETVERELGPITLVVTRRPCSATSRRDACPTTSGTRSSTPTSTASTTSPVRHCPG